MRERAEIRKKRARELRKYPTPSEEMIWVVLRDRRLKGFKFRRQYAIGPYFADFCCVRLRLVVELDGYTHSGREASDRRRDGYMRSRGYTVLRFKDDAVYENQLSVLELIERKCMELALRPRD